MTIDRRKFLGRSAGYVPFEALGGGDPRVKVASFLEKIRRAFGL
ncbi:MAG TPA: hypothetical protein VKF41_01135 [Bryobacteraceae bacterium]|nr:hypothetical protein [Bryobacteraceae bacterium]